MNDVRIGDAGLSTHVAASVESLIELQRRHEDRLEDDQRLIERATRMLGRPRTAFTIALLAAVWIVLNLALAASHARAPDPPPFSYLSVTASVAALLMTVVILTTENRVKVAEERRAQLDLQLALMTEQKVAKIIELLEQLRHDDPNLRDRIDPEAIAMTQPANPHAVVDALETRDPR